MQQEKVFVARERETDELKSHLDYALDGKGRVCFVAGLAGSGKTALVQHFAQSALAAEPDLVVAAGSCNAQTGIGDPYLPFREALAMLTDETAAEKAAGKVSLENASRLLALMASSVQILFDVAPYLFGLLIPGGKLVGALGKTLAKQTGLWERLDTLSGKTAMDASIAEPIADQTHVFGQYTAFLRELSQEVPLILFLDDLQWADKASLNLLFHLGRRLEDSRILIIGAYRPEDTVLGRGGERHPLEAVVHELTRYYGDVTVDLDAIPEGDNQRFVAELLDVEPNCLGSEFREALFSRTGGHALFTVELVKAMRDRGDLVRDAEGCWVEGPTLDWTALPERVEGVVEERIARLDVELQELLLVCSVEGEEFTAEVASRVQGLDELSTVRFLSAELEDQHRLVNAEGLVRIGSLQLSRYRFAHTLLQQYLYGTLDPVQRSYMNQAVGQALETLFGDQTAPLAAKLARHFEEAGLPAKAAGYRLEAAQRAHQMSAHDEAVAHLNEGLDLLADQPKDIPRRELELQLQTALATVLSVAQGYASPNVAQAYSRARDLSRELGDPPLAVPALYGLCAYHFVRSELEQAYQEGEQLLKLTESADDAGYWLGAQLVLGAAAMHLGQHDRARQHLEAAIDRYDPVGHRLVAHHLGHDPAVGAFSYMALVLQVQGYPGQATQAMESALALAQELDHPYSRGYAASFAAMLLQLQRRLSECYELAKEALQIGRDRRFPLWQAIGDMSRGWVMSQRGRGEAGIAELAQGLATWEGSGAVLALPFQRTLLAEAFLRAGERDKGLQALAGSFCCPQDVWWRPEQHRLYAELLLLVPGHEAQATASLQQALALAEESQARFLELRAAMSLSRLLHQQGRTNEAYDLLASRYAWFREGFETPDLKQARELLDLVRRDAEGDGGLSGSERTGEGMSEAELAGDPARRSETPLAAGPTANRSGTPAIRMEA